MVFNASNYRNESEAKQVEDDESNLVSFCPESVIAAASREVIEEFVGGPKEGEREHCSPCERLAWKHKPEQEDERRHNRQRNEASLRERVLEHG